jgi:carboxymethylenebutenolidase
MRYVQIVRSEILDVDARVMADGQDATLSVDLLMSLENCTGRIASTGMCLGGHLVRPILYTTTWT